mmetsp:Transcript_23060/g.78415  ORF Transcript_23060/g.78415 Transcript_23060/m.78415 type:complete len:150 (-) Transcript_23060:309-758(-)
MGQSANAYGSRIGFYSAYDVLDDIIGSGEEFEEIFILASPLNLLVDHHQVCLKHRSHNCCVLDNCDSFLIFDYGQRGLAVECERYNPAGTGTFRAITTKRCVSHPDAVKAALIEVQQKRYHLVTWNCQHFAQHMLERLSNDVEHTDSEF